MVGFTKTNAEPTLQIKLLSAGLAGCIGDVITFPLDVAKVRLQVQGEGSVPGAPPKYRGMLPTISTIVREEGPRALYNGLSPGLQRQVAFCTVRIGLYDSVKQSYIGFFQKGGNKDTSSGGNILLRILAGITTGGMAVMCAQPTDVVKVRMQAQTSGPRYKGSLDAYRTIANTEGVRGLWKGLMPNVARNAIVNAAELVSYDFIKEKLLHYQVMADAMPCHVTSAFGGGFCTTVVASPVDVVKTRIMNSPQGAYNGAIDCAIQMWREGGPRAFYKGFFPSFLRIASWNIVMFVCFEQLKRGLSQASYFRSGSSTSRGGFLTQ